MMSEKTVRVLLIEDNPGDARLVREAFRDLKTSLQVSLEHVTLLSSALAYLEHQAVDAVLLDLTLPDSHGSETFFRLQAQAGQVPIILLTGLDDEELAQTLMRAGAQDFLLKGEVDGNILMRSIRYAIERKLSEDNLRSSEERYRMLVEQASDGIFTADRRGNFLDVNTAGSEMLGYTREELLGMNMRQLVVDYNSFRIGSFTRKLIAGQVVMLELELLSKAGAHLQVEISARMLADGRQQGIARDISARRLAELELRESHAFNQLLVKSIPFRMEIVDQDGRILYMDPQLEAAQGGQPTDQHCWNIHRENQEQCQHCPLKEPIEIGRTQTTQVSGIKGGRILEVTHTGMMYKGRKALLEIFQDVTERKDIEMALLKAHAEMEQKVIDRTFELRSANVQLEKAARIKDEFLASMSHELRTPLTGILGLSEALQMVTYGDLSEKQLKAIKNIETSGRHLLSLINDILDLSKIEAGMFNMQFSPASLDGVCQASLQMMKGMASQKHLKVSFSMEPASIVLRADPRRLKQMLINLLGNAVKFTPDGGQVGIEVEGLAGQKQVRISVWDTGIGIKPEDLERLFMPFVQLDSKLSRQYSGTGLGLSLVKRMAELQGGQVEVESVYGSGSRFSILLPWVVDATQPLMYTRRVSDRMQSALCFDLQAESAQRLTSMLNLIGVKPQLLTNFENGVDLAVQFWPDVIFINDCRPGVDGFKLLRLLKTDLRTHTIPVVLISRIENRKAASLSRADGLLMEPFAQDELYAELQQVANRTSGAG